MGVREFNGLSLQFNAMVMTMARKFVPMGWTPREDAPDTLYGVTQMYLANRGHMYVWDGASDQTMFDDPEHNYAWRAWHDMVHVQHQFTFTPEGEKLTVVRQITQMFDQYGVSPDTLKWSSWMYADIVGAVEYEQLHGHFPVKQRDFVEAYAKLGRQVLNTEW